MYTYLILFLPFRNCFTYYFLFRILNIYECRSYTHTHTHIKKPVRLSYGSVYFPAIFTYIIPIFFNLTFLIPPAMDTGLLNIITNSQIPLSRLISIDSISIYG